ncbi:DUF3427 domain-containing protein [Halobacillus seohaensis]|uniref:DUF3427 domain-containing protein n=1 Tax=Halobacillus seohaensis TaxID=447421 RepID=A0ABW2ENS6_9BACI
MENIIEQMQHSFQKGFIDRNHSQSSRFRPELLVNQASKRQDVLTTLVDELKSCQSFMFSVAFITESGLATLKSHLLDLYERGIRGKILTSTFQMFNKPKVFRELLKIKNVDVRIADVEGFHSKGYIFHHDTFYSLIVGSSNLTANALKVNYEWNLKLTSHENGEIIHHFHDQFEEMWGNAQPLTEHWIDLYEEEYVHPHFSQVAEFPGEYKGNRLKDSLAIYPNKMQKAALKGIESVRQAEENRALIVSATGTGKTYLSAFGVRSVRPKRMLFVVHREQILQKAKQDFHRVLGGEESDFGILSGSVKETDSKYLFATVQMMSKPEVMQSFDPEEFDYILIDEVHKAGSMSYLQIIEYFKPEFLLGMTATPERTDGFNLFELFDYNVAYEIRLQEALEEDMLTPFHYVGVTDLIVEGEELERTDLFTHLTAGERVDRVIEKIDYYGYSGERVSGLIFCSSKQEARKLSQQMNERGFSTVALTGEDSQEIRREQVLRLENGALDYILTVDIFNEGIDIPCINQVVMLRQTKSSIVFIQQLGRGLRKHDTKNYVTVIDFIGNYENNYLIPIALSGDYTQNKDNIRRRMIDTSYIQGTSTVNFEEVAKQRIYDAIKTAKLTHMKVLRDAYKELKNRIGRVPLLADFHKNHSIDPRVLVDKKDNYHEFLIAMKEEIEPLSKYEQQVLTMFSLEILNGKREHEVVLLDLLMENEKVSYESFKEKLQQKNCRTDEHTLRSVERIFKLSFFTSNDTKKYGSSPIIELNEYREFEWNPRLKKKLSDNGWFRTLVRDIIHVSYIKNEQYSSDLPLTPYQKYSRKDACKLLNWDNDEGSTVYGYKPKHQTCPIFITYHKKDDVESSINYEDQFINPEILKWYTRSNRTINSNEVQEIIEARERQNDIHLFVKKDDGEGSDFYYLGKALPDKNTVEETTMKDKTKELPVVRMNMMIEQNIDQKIYDYLHE